MPLTPDDISRLDDRARDVGRKIGWDMRFVVAPNPQYVGVTAGPDNVFVLGPANLADLAANDIELDLAALERGDRQVRPDEDGDPLLG